MAKHAVTILLVLLLGGAALLALSRIGGGDDVAAGYTSERENELRGLMSEIDGSSRVAQTERGRPELERFVRDAEHLRDELAKLADAARSWEQSIAPLRTNDEGRLLAAKPAYAEAVAELLERERTPSHVAEGNKARIESIRAAVSVHLEGSGPYEVEQEARRTVQSIGEGVGEQLASYVADSAHIQSLLTAARTQGLTPSSKTLAQLLKDAETARVAAAAELAKQRRDEEEAAQLAADEEKARLTARAKSPEVQQLYSAFLAKGQFDSASRTLKEGPPFSTSLKNLNYHAVLDVDYLFASFACGRFCQYTGQGVHPGHGGMNFQLNDRPTVSDYPSTEEEWKVWARRREEFKELAPVFVELGMLRP